MMNAAYGVMVNDENLFYSNFSENALPMRTVGVFNPTSASTGLNMLLAEMDECRYEVGILIHQDVVIPEGWIGTVEKRLEELPDNWLVAGLWGVRLVEEKQHYYGHLIDSRIARKIGSDKPIAMHAGPLPTEVDALDELCLIVNLRHGFRFDKRMRGFDLYGTYICLWAKKHGLSAWAIDAKATHDTRRSFAWKPDAVFHENWDLLTKEFAGLPVVSTVYC